MHRIAIINSARARALAASAKVGFLILTQQSTVGLIPVLHEILFQSANPLVARSYATAKPGWLFYTGYMYKFGLLTM